MIGREKVSKKLIRMYQLVQEQEARANSRPLASGVSVSVKPQPVLTAAGKGLPRSGQGEF